MKYKILVTGGAGFIGSHVVDAYIEAGHHVAVVDDFSTGFRRNLNPQASIFEGNIQDKGFIKEVFNHFAPNIVNHHAAQISVEKSVEDPLLDSKINIEGTLNLLEASKQKIQKFIFASSGGAVYGNQSGASNEETCPNPISPYGISKLACEQYLNFYSKQYPLKIQILRYSNVYGDRQNALGEAGVITKFFHQFQNGVQPMIYGDGNNTRDFVFVGDVASANLLALHNDKEGVWNISSNTETSVNDLYDQISVLVNARSPKIHGSARNGEVRNSKLDNTKVIDELGWTPKFDLYSGLKMLSESK